MSSDMSELHCAARVPPILATQPSGSFLDNCAHVLKIAEHDLSIGFN